MSEIKYEIVKKIGVLSTSRSGWTKELNLISWNDREPKYDLRDRSAEREKMGISLRVVEKLRQNGYDAVHLAEQGHERLNITLPASSTSNRIC